MSAFDEDYDPFADLDMAAEDEAEAMAEFSRIIAQDAPPLPEEEVLTPTESEPSSPPPKSTASCSTSP